MLALSITSRTGSLETYKQQQSTLIQHQGAGCDGGKTNHRHDRASGPYCHRTGRCRSGESGTGRSDRCWRAHRSISGEEAAPPQQRGEIADEAMPHSASGAKAAIAPQDVVLPSPSTKASKMRVPLAPAQMSQAYTGPPSQQPETWANPAAAVHSSVAMVALMYAA